MRQEFNLHDKKIWIPGANGMVGSALVRRLEKDGINCIATRRQDVDLLDTNQVNNFYANMKPDGVILSAAKVGGIHANNTYPADFLSQNIRIQQNVIDGAYEHGVQKLLFLGSTCIYPKHCHQPINEDSLLTGPLEPTNEWYAIAKIAGVKLCQAYRKQYGCDFISAMPTNLYGPNDNFDPENSHVPAALLQRFHQAKINGNESVTVWGTGTPLRDFLHVDDLADACIFLMQNYSDASPVNVGMGQDISIGDFAHLIATVVEFKGDIVFDTTRPNGTPRKCTDASKIHAIGWKHSINLEDGLKKYYQWYLEKKI